MNDYIFYVSRFVFMKEFVKIKWIYIILDIESIFLIGIDVL